MDCPRACCDIDAITQWKYCCSARYDTHTIVVRTIRFHEYQCSFGTVVGHTSHMDTNSRTAWWLPARWRLSWHESNGLWFAPGCWELLYRFQVMWYWEPAEVVTGAGWMIESGAMVVFTAGGNSHGSPEWLLPASWDLKGATGQWGLAPLWINC
jgi:hypothetical protein